MYQPRTDQPVRITFLIDVIAHFNGAEISKKFVDLTVELVKPIGRLLQSVESARIIAQNFLFDGGR
jgi:hypothetical protein